MNLATGGCQIDKSEEMSVRNVKRLVIHVKTPRCEGLSVVQCVIKMDELFARRFGWHCPIERSTCDHSAAKK
ncbi:hypothetical protein HDF14_005383 [Edaphobacter lichenicola]|uniref:Uncharacterized protein n=1 Tax=Tunturiibacter gelidiferens TaxID=3069689 RepID=A0A9X0U6K7_9BACT|nr:hypothetical protein [Edaphobacter lichenicola]